MGEIGDRRRARADVVCSGHCEYGIVQLGSFVLRGPKKLIPSRVQPVAGLDADWLF